MIFSTLWERYLFREVVKVFFSSLGCFFLVYGLIDYSLHMQDFVSNEKIQFSQLLSYYSFQFIKRATFLIPISLLITTLKVLFSMNLKGELVSLKMAGLRVRTLLRPFFFLAFLCALFNWASAEWFLPSSLNYLDKFREDHFKHSYRGHRKEPIHFILLKDKSKILYQTEDKSKGIFIDAFWIRSIDEVWRIQTLSSDPSLPIGNFVDHLERNTEGNFEKVASFETFHFPQMERELDPIGKGLVPLENRGLSALFALARNQDSLSDCESAQVKVHLLSKFAIPLLSFLVVIAASPFCVQHSRNLPIFWTYAVSLFGLIALLALMDAVAILGENLVLSPYTAILTPIACCLFGFGSHYLKKT